MTKNKINTAMIYLLIISTLLPYIPNFGVSRYIYYIIFACMFIYNVKDILFGIIKKHMISVFFIICILMYFAIITIFSKQSIEYVDLNSIIMSFIIFVLFNSIKIEDYSKVLYRASITCIVISTIIMYMIKGDLSMNLSVTEYFFASKNAMGPIMIFAALYIMYTHMNIKKSYLNIFMYSLTLWVLFLIQARSCIVGIFLGTFWIFHKYYFKSRLTRKQIFRNVIILFIIGIILIAIGEFAFDFLLKVLKIEKGASLSKISSGRNLAIDASMKYFKDNMLIGAKYYSSIVNQHASIHNLWIRSLIYGGVLYFCILISYVFTLFVRIIKNSKDKNIILVFILPSIVTSMLEPTAPFGPGSTYLIFWAIMGIYSNKDNYRFINKETVTNNNETIRYKYNYSY